MKILLLDRKSHFLRDVIYKRPLIVNACILILKSLLLKMRSKKFTSKSSRTFLISKCRDNISQSNFVTPLKLASHSHMLQGEHLYEKFISDFK